MPKIKKILVLYKKSSYQTYFRDERNFPRHLRISAQDRQRFAQTHLHHYQTLATVERFLKANHAAYTKFHRGRDIDFKAYDLIITVGGDGTFLRAARQITRQLVLGINSDPKWSVGKFCTANNHNFPGLLGGVLQGRFKVRRLNRLQLSVPGKKIKMNILNEALICHKNPAAMSRYYLQIGKHREEQKSSGIWISSAAGSSGAIRSAGGKILPPDSAYFQYKPRELYRGVGKNYHLTGDVLPLRQRLEMTSLMKDGMIFIDGCHCHIPFHFAERIIFTRSPEPLRVVH